MKLARSQMFSTRLWTKSCPDSLLCPLDEEQRQINTPCKKTGPPWVLPPWRAHTGKQSWLEGAKAGRPHDKCRMVEGRRALHPTLSLAVLQGRRMHGRGGAVQRP